MYWNMAGKFRVIGVLAAFGMVFVLLPRLFNSGVGAIVITCSVLLGIRTVRGFGRSDR
jgi:hypothetical protein